MAASENRFASELNEKEVIELLEDLSYICQENIRKFRMLYFSNEGRYEA